MKRIFVVALCMAFLAPMTYGQSNVLSQNAVGYVKLTIPKGGLALARLDFESLDPSVIANARNLIGDQLPTDSAVFIWDVATSQYIPETKGSRSGWPNSENSLDRGTAFWIQVPDTAAEESYDVYLMGEVPGANNNSETNTIEGIEGIDALGYAYPAAIDWTNTQLSALLPSGSTIFIWDIATQAYLPFNKGARSGWGATGNALVLDPGTSFWVDVGDDSIIDWTEVKPYDWP